jgi:hypothetical protein
MCVLRGAAGRVLLLRKLMLITVKCPDTDTHHFRGASSFKIEGSTLTIYDKDDSPMAGFAPGRWNYVVTTGEGE